MELIKRILIGGTGSGCGKTTVTMAILSALKMRGCNAVSFKCGPDYIDPMFHRQILGVKTRNLDPFFLDAEGLNKSLSASSSFDIAVIEGVMGYYDGIGASSEASTHEVAEKTKTPAILVMNPKGMCASAGAILYGYTRFHQSSGLQGVIFNGLNEKMYQTMQKIASDAGLISYGFLPKNEDIQIPSRHLGLSTDIEKDKLREKVETMGHLAEKYIDLNGLLALAETAPPIEQHSTVSPVLPAKVRIAVARDPAFCFLYDENIEVLESLGCEIAWFSPLNDSALPDNIGGLYLCGGYPELYAQKLSSNKSMLTSVRNAVNGGLPTIAECGGFMYLHEQLSDFPMVGVIPAKAFETKSLKHFGYITLEAKSNNLLCKSGDSIKAHEFHYWNSTDDGNTFTAKKARRDVEYPCIHSSETLFAGFPHIFFPSNPKSAEHFAEKAAGFAEKHN